MLLSFVIPVYNAENYIQGCLDSILSQQLDRNQYEIVIVNDGSEDNSRLILDEYAEKFLNVRVLNQKNQGASKARNEGAYNALGDFVFFVDADDEILPGSLTKLYSYLSQNKDVQIILPDSAFSSLSLKAQTNRIKKQTGLEIAKKGFVVGSSWGAALSSKFFRHFQIRFPEGVQNNEDVLFWGVCFACAENVAFLDFNWYRVIPRDNSLSRQPYEKMANNALSSIEIVGQLRDKYSFLSIEQRGIIETQIYRFISTMTFEVIMSDNLCLRSIIRASIFDLLPLDVKYMYRFKVKAVIMNISFSLFYYLTRIKYRKLLN